LHRLLIQSIHRKANREFDRLGAYPEESFSGLQLMCLMFAELKRIAPDQDVGMDLNEPWVAALELFNPGR
jgi:hypothetical protein